MWIFPTCSRHGQIEARQQWLLNAAVLLPYLKHYLNEIVLWGKSSARPFLVVPILVGNRFNAHSCRSRLTQSWMWVSKLKFGKFYSLTSLVARVLPTYLKIPSYERSNLYLELVSTLVRPNANWAMWSCLDGPAFPAGSEGMPLHWGPTYSTLLSVRWMQLSTHLDLIPWR